MKGSSQYSHVHDWPGRGSVGLVLVTVFWTLNWSLAGLRTHWGFFPLWLGYCLAVDAWSYRCRGTSLWARSPMHYVGLFVVSAPTWWLFELVNLRTGNWHYQGREAFGDLEYFLWATLSFSTVIPAVFGTAELVGSARWIRTLPRTRSLNLPAASRAVLIVVGAAMLLLTLCWPRYFFPFVWLSLFLVVDPLNDILEYRSLLRSASRGDWRGFVSLGLGCLICGFFWELWNFFSYPKWTYEIPFVDFLRIFEMPVLGYGGYLGFSVELFAIYHLVRGILIPVGSQSFVRIGEERSAVGDNA